MATVISMRELEENLDRFLQRVEDGETMEITRHGKVVARLLPPDHANLKDQDPDDLWKSLAKKATGG